MKNVILLAAEESVTDMSSALNSAVERMSNNTATLVKLLQTLLYILRGCGFVLLAYAIGKMVLAFRNEDTENKLQAISLLFVAILLITANSYLNKIFGGVSGWTPL